MKKDSLIKIIIKSVLGLCGLALLVLVITRDSLLPEDSFIVAIFDEANELGIIEKIAKSAMIIFIAVTLYIVIKMIIQVSLGKSLVSMTILNLLINVAKYLVGIIVLLMVLSAFGVDTGTLVASAGILSLILGLGCQTLIADIVSGLFIIFEGDFKVGDVVVINGWRGSVQSIGLRTTKIIDASGNVNIVNNSSISNIINNTKELSIAVCTCGVDYNDSIERIERIIQINLDYMKKRIPAIIEGPFYKGVDELADSAVVIKLVAKCKEDDKYQIQRDMNRELKIIFDKNKVNIPFPQVVVNNPSDPIYSKPINMDDFVDEQKRLSKDIEEQEN